MKSMIQFPPQMLPYNKKGKKWRKQVIDWADANGSFNYSPVRKSVINKKINYDLVNGILHMKDLQRIVNPEGLTAGFIPKDIPHYPIINSKLNVLVGEESKRVFDFKVIVTNPNAISEIEKTKKQELFTRLLQAIQNTASSEEEFQLEILEIYRYFTYEWLDMREVRSNCLLRHYMKEYNILLMFNDGFKDALTVGEEMYQCDIVSGEPVISRINPKKIRIFRAGTSNKIEDADMIILEDYWSPGRIIDYYHEYLTEKDIKYILGIPNNGGQETTNQEENDPREGFIYKGALLDDLNQDSYSSLFYNPEEIDSLSPYDMEGNVRVLRVFWKSFRKIKKVKSYNIQTQEVEYNFYPETYIINEELGEEEQIFYINEAWEGTKIGRDIYVCMRPKVVQYNSLSNPSRCHFGIVGSIYNFNDSKPYSMVDMMKPFNYYYDVIHDRLNKLIFKNMGKLITLDLAKVPKGWDVEKWFYYARVNGLMVVDSYKEGNVGAATGKLAGTFNNTTPVIDAELGNTILNSISLLEYIKSEMSDVVGISRQREGQISNRETVGGVERATLQSSHITEHLFVRHEDVKKRALECFLETAKACLKGNNKKFQYILPDYTLRIIEIDGDEFAEADYGLVVDNSSGTQKLDLQLDMLAQAALQNLTLNFSTIMKLYSSSSLAEKQRMVELNEIEMMLRALQLQELLLQVLQLLLQQLLQTEMLKMQQEDTMNLRDNETKIIVATINAESKLSDNIDDGILEMSAADKEKFQEQIRQFNTRLELDKEKLALDRDKADTDAKLKRMQINKQRKSE